MSNINLIKELRELTQAGMKDCKDALTEANWDLQKAIDLVKIKGLNIVSGREGKVASEGMINIASLSGRSDQKFMVEVNCQTDFVANSKDFKDFCNHVIEKLCLNQGEFKVSDVEDMRKGLVSLTKENISVRRWWIEQAQEPTVKVFDYLHANSKIGVIITMMASSEEMANSSEFRQLGEDLAMQIAALSPIAISVDRLSAEDIERQKSIFETQLTELNKPVAAWPKILDGKFNKWYSDVCLLNQESVLVSKTSVEQVIKNVANQLGGTIKVINFIRSQVGDGLDKKEVNFAKEVELLSGVKGNSNEA